MDAPPNYADELAKCQRYYYKEDYITTIGCVTNSGKSYDMAPSITMEGWVGRMGTGGYSQHTPNYTFAAPVNLTIQSDRQSSTQCITLRDTIATAVDTNNSVVQYHIKGLKLSADL